MFSEPLNGPGRDENAPDGPERHQEPAESPTEPTADASTDNSTEHEAQIAELTQQIAELEREKADREREDAITALAERYSHLTPEILRMFGKIPTEELEERARVLNAAIDEREEPTVRLGAVALTRRNQSAAVSRGRAHSGRRARNAVRDEAA